MLARWDAEGTFAKLREQNKGGPTFSFIDGPVTANRFSLGVHTAWGRTLKDVFQRYKALRGFDQRYQNGFDSQGLWIEVGVERELGLNSKREIEEFGLEEFARRCRDVVVRSSEALTRGSIRLGQWMDWGKDYFTFSDTNIEYVWRMLKSVHERDWLYMGHRSTEWCPRCGTSISQHELIGSYVDRADPSLYVRFPLLDRAGEYLVVWTTTPWTLPANVAAAVNPDAEYGRRANGEWVAAARYPDEAVRGKAAGHGARRLDVPRPVRRHHPGRASRHSVGRGLARRGHRHRPHRAGLRQRGLRALAGARARDRPAGRRVGALLRQLRLAPRALDDRGGGADHRQPRGEGRPRRGRAARAPLSRVLALPHAAHLPHRRRLVHLGPRAAAADARRERDGRVDARVHGQADGRLAPQHGRLEHLPPPLLRAAAAVLPVRVRASQRDRVARRARGACGLGARAARGAPAAVDRPRAGALRGVRRAGRADQGGRRRLARRRDRPVLDARLAERRAGWRRATGRAPRAG